MNTDKESECKFCGVKFSGKCPSCNFPHPQTARFCFNCGCKLSGPEIHSSVENYGTLAESRKNVAVMFADVSGFTSLSERLDPEEVREIINECFNYITSPVYELEGTIDKYIGDCIMILFGARHSHTDDAKRAVLCAMKMQGLISEFSNNVLSSRGLKLSLSIGINYGLVVTGGVGNYFDRDYTVMGDIVNTAQRLQMSAGEGTILVSDSVFSETKDKFEYSSSKEVKVKNKENLVKCYSPLGINNEFFYEKELPFIERQKEISQLNSIYNDALNFGMKFIILTGETGIGKSRLIKEFSNKLGSDIKKVCVECNAISQNKSYSMIAGILSGIMNINSLDSHNMRKHRLISFLDYILDSYSDSEIKRNYDFLSLVMGLERDNEFQLVFESMNYESIRRELLKQLSLFFTNLYRKQKLVILVDDAQWADAGSLQIINDLVPMLKDIKSIVVFSSRYGLKSFLQEEDVLTYIRLNTLTISAVRSLSCSLLNVESIETGFLDAIYGFTNGNPLYIKELLTNIKKKGIYRVKKGEAFIEEKELEMLPVSIQNLIISNLSVLDANCLKILQAAAAIGKEFSFSLLSHLLDKSVADEDISGIPVQLNFIDLKATHTSSHGIDRIYEFSHEIEREIIYDGILNKDKKTYHKKIGEYIETNYPEDLHNYYEILCLHFEKAGIAKKAAGYYYKTATKHKNIFNLNVSLDYYDKFLKLAFNDAAFYEEIFNTHLEIGNIHLINANYEAALANFNKAMEYTKLQDNINYLMILVAEVYKDMGRTEEAINIVDDIGTRIRENSNIYGRWVQIKCNLLRIKGDNAALRLAKKYEKVILKSGDYRSLSETMKHAGMIYFNKGDIDNALSYMNKSFKYAEKNNLLEIMAKVSGDLGIIYHSTGLISKALEFFNKSMEISRKISYQRGIIAACINLGILYLDKGQFINAQKLFIESLLISREVGSRLYECVSLTNLGDISYETGEFDTSSKYYKDSSVIAREIKAPIEEGVNMLGSAKILIKLDKYTEASKLIDTAHKIFSEADELISIGDCHTFNGYIDQSKGSLETAEIFYNKALTIYIECRNDKKKLRILRYKADILMKKGLYNEAIDLYISAIQEADKLESDYELAKCWYGRYLALNAAGLVNEASESLKKAGSYIDKVDYCRWKDIILHK